MLYCKIRLILAPILSPLLVTVAQIDVRDTSRLVLYDWSQPWPDYSPTEFTASFVLSAPWADPDLQAEDFRPQWNTVGQSHRLTLSHLSLQHTYL